MEVAAGPKESRRNRRVIWIVNQYAGSPAHGMEFRHYELAREFVRAGVTVVIISGSYSHLFTRRPRARGAFTHEVIDGITYCWVKVPSYRGAQTIGRVINMFAFMLRLYRLPVRLFPSPDSIVVSSPSLFPILPAERWAKQRRAQLVFEVRDIWPLTLQQLGRLSNRHPLVLLMRWFEGHAYSVADLVVTVLPDAGAYFESRGLARSKLHVIPNGVSEDVLAAPAGAGSFEVRELTEGDEFVVGFVGTLGMANAVDVLIGAAALLGGQNVRFVIVGHGPDAQQLRDLADGLVNVRFTGPVAKTDVPATLRRFDACYLGYHRSPLYRFGIAPNKLYDYMAAGRPIVFAGDSSNDAIREAGCGVTVAPDDPAALAEAICQLRDMPPGDRERLGANGRAYVEREHRYRSLAARYLSLLAGSSR
jgi:glycosyltransferase involved in cell wall biosynthesis